MLRPKSLDCWWKRIYTDLWISDHCPFADEKGDMNERNENEFLDQAITAFLSGSYHIRNAAMTAMRCYMQHRSEYISGFKRYGKMSILARIKTVVIQMGKEWYRNTLRIESDSFSFHPVFYIFLSCFRKKGLTLLAVKIVPSNGKSERERYG